MSFLFFDLIFAYLGMYKNSDILMKNEKGAFYISPRIKDEIKVFVRNEVTE